MSIGSRIKELRESKNISRNEFATMIGVTIGAVSNYENDVSSPKEPILFNIIEALDCDANYLFQDVVKIKKQQNDVTLAEYDMIKQYRALDPDGQSHVETVLQWELARTNALQEHADRITELETALHNSNTTLRIYTYMRKIAAAGTGFYFDDIPTDTIEAPFLENADFIIGVSGDSMEPTYSDGDLVYVEKCQTIETGSIGIFILNKECFIKEAGEDGLLSHNQKYDKIPGSSDIICVGKVLGKVNPE